jgi:outer membrane protein assembly factor BamB
VGDLVVVSSCNGLIRGLDQKTGRLKWEYDIRKDGDQRQFHGDPLVTEELVIIGTDGNMGHVYAFDRSTGVVRWKYRVNEHGVSSDLIRLGDKIYAVTLGNELVSLDLKTGKVIWTFRSSYSGQDTCLTCSSPVAIGDRVYFGGMDGFAYALDAQNGNLIWKHDLGGQVTTSSALAGNDLYMGTKNRHLFRIDSASGDVVKDFPTQSQPWGHLVITGDSVLVLLGDEMLVSVDPLLTRIRWSAEASKEWTSARPYVWRDLVLAGNRRELVAFHSGDGSRAWSHQFPETVRGIGTSPDVLYVGTLKGPIFAYSPNPQKE